MIEERLRNHLIASPEIAKIASDRIYPIIARKDASLPMIIYTFTSKSPEDELMGSSVLITNSLVNVAILAQEPEEAILLARLVQNRLSRSAFEDRNAADSRVILLSQFIEERQSFDGNIDLIVVEQDYRLKYRSDLE